MYEYDENQMLDYNVKSFKKSNFWEFSAIDRTWSTLVKFYYSHFHKWKKRYFKGLYKIWNKIISFHMTNKVKFKTSHGVP
jgi:hypothetical protein